MKLTTLNLQGFTNWEARKSEIIDYLSTVDSDVIVFQEVVFIPDESSYNQVQLLNQTLGYPYEHSAVTRLQPSHEYATFREGLAVLSRYPVTKTDTVVLKKAEGDEHNRILQLIDITVGDAQIKLANIHFSLTDTVDYATAHFEETLEIIHNHNEKRIMAGDFNIDHLEDLSYMWDAGYEASTNFPYVSFPPENKRNDYVLVPKPYRITSLETSSEKLSDHSAVTVDIDILL